MCDGNPPDEKFKFNECVFTSPITGVFIEVTPQGDNHYVTWIKRSKFGCLLYYQEAISKSMYEKVKSFLVYREAKIAERDRCFEIKYQREREKHFKFLRNS